MSHIIKQLMMQDHKNLEHLLIETSKFLKTDRPHALALFSKFRWNLEKHIFAEDKAIFSLLQMISGEEITSTFDLMNEHRELLSLVEEVEKKKEQDLEPLIQELTKLLKAHALLEEESFYPEIDDYLNENDKKELEEKIKEIIKN